MTNLKGLILAADIWQKDRLLSTVEQVSPYIEAVKIGNVALLDHGWGIIKEVKEFTDKPVIVDLKLMDIPYIAEMLARKALMNEADGILICGPAGGDTISVCKGIFEKKMVFVFTQFTHMTGLISDEMADEYIDLAIILRCDGIQVPATMPQRISAARKKVGDNLTIISCGVGEQGADIGSAISAGADYEIIGRGIYNPRPQIITPREAAMLAKKRIMEQLRNDKIYLKKKDLTGLNLGMAA